MMNQEEIGGCKICSVNISTHMYQQTDFSADYTHLAIVSDFDKQIGIGKG